MTFVHSPSVAEHQNDMSRVGQFFFLLLGYFPSPFHIQIQLDTQEQLLKRMLSFDYLYRNCIDLFVFLSCQNQRRRSKSTVRSLSLRDFRLKMAYCR